MPTQNLNLTPRTIKYSLAILSLITGSMIYFPIFLILDPLFLVPHSEEFTEDASLFVLSLFCLGATCYVWQKIIRQFKIDRTVLGYSTNTNGYAVLITLTIEAIIILLLWWHFG